MASKKSKMGRPSIFQDKTERIQGAVTKIGRRRLNDARGELAIIAGWTATDVSDADAIEYLARGKEETIAYLNRRK
jgi:hypothetical protein